MAEGIIEFEQLRSADLIVDAIYKSGPHKDIRADPLDPLLACGNQGGFRTAGGLSSPRYVVLYSSQEDADWPDHLDLATGLFTYFGDNKRYGHLLHETQRGGNRL